ncbi:MAG: cytochrome b [Alphaproteobacteria bacterium]|nr:cytochrome b [Alphaproteobacteria bacterium]
MSKTTTKTYDATAQTIHWGTAFAVFVMFLTAMFMDAPENLVSQEMKQTIITTHKSTGFLILCLMIVRVLWFMRHARPPLPSQAMPHWQVIAARYVHAALYVLGLLTPIVGWALVSMGSHDLTVYNLFEIPALPLANLAQEHPYVRELCGDAHETLATLFAGLIVVHIGATILHHFVDRDDILLRIVPHFTHRWLRKIRGD